MCRYSVKGKAGSCSSFRVLPYGNEKTLQAAVASVGPMAVAINARLPSFHLYRGGEVEVKANSEKDSLRTLFSVRGANHQATTPGSVDL